MILTLDTSGGTYIIPLVNGADVAAPFDPGTSFFFNFFNYTCSGTPVTTCNPGQVFLTGGAIGSGSVTDVVSFATPTGPSGPPPGTTPEPSSLVLLGTGLLGLTSLRRKLFAR